MTPRLPTSPAERINRLKHVAFLFDGRRIEALEGDTVGSALAASGVKVLSRSFKYHRPRGLLCCSGRCPNCLVDIDGVPNVRACVEPVRDGMLVRHQNAWPSLSLDIFSLVNRVPSVLLPVGFYYKIFHRPAALWPFFEKILRQIAGLGRIDVHHPKHHDTRIRNITRDVVVVGGGPAGCVAALEAAAAGASVLVIDDQPELGGHLRLRTSTNRSTDPRVANLAGPAAADRLRTLIAAESRIEVLASTTAFGIYEGGMLGAVSGGTYYRVRGAAIVVAAGTQERPLVFENNDLPGIMLGTGALRLARLAGVPAGERLVIVVDDQHGWNVADALRVAGLQIAAVADLRDVAAPESAESLASAGVELLRNVTVVTALGGGAVSGLRVTVAGGARDLVCDTVVMALRPEPVTTLLAHGGTRVYDERLGEFVSAAREANVLAAGEVEGLLHDGFIVASAVAAGREAAALAGRQPADLDGARAERERQRAAASATVDRRVPLPIAYEGKSFVCVCEDITGKELTQAIQEGFDELELIKRYSTTTMGPCQGKMCHVASARHRASTTGASMADTGLTTSRPPFQPVPMALLAGPHLAPVRRTAMHWRHEAGKPKWTDLGDWKRTYIHTSVEKECRAVRTAVGIIDVSSLGKFEITGADAGTFLDWLHPNTFSDLRSGRVRYRAMCDDSGIILDDGTVARFGDRFFLTTTSSGTEAVDQWLKWWLAGSTRRVNAVNVTGQLAAVNVAGPRSREVLAKLTALDVSKEGFPYLAAREAVVAGIPATIIRIGFVGELAYEIHVAADYGTALWDALLTAGAEFDIQPFGVEAQRVLRLEKQHLIVSQDTDALTNPLEAGLDWMIKADRPDFVGRAAIALMRQNGPKNALVGFEIASRTVPAEGVAVIADGKLAGRVTSAKWSDTLGKTIGLASVDVALGKEGRLLQIRHEGQIVEGRVVLKPFYDPTGARLRS